MTATRFFECLLSIWVLRLGEQLVLGQTCPPDYNVYVRPEAPGQLTPCTTSTCPSGVECLTVSINLVQFTKICCILRGTNVGTGTAGPGGICNSNVLCTGGSVCTAGLCSCPVGATPSGTSCLTTNVINPFGTVCTNGQALVNGQCLSQVPPNQPCTANEQCTGNSVCSNQVCTCLTGQTAVGNVCTVSGGILPIPNVVVPQPTFATACGFHQVSMVGRCYDRVPPDQTCTFTEQCTHGSICDPVLKTCKCQPPQSNMGGTCAVPGGFSNIG